MTCRHHEYRIALYYCYVPIGELEAHIEFQKSLCHSRSLKGRVRVATEGVNGVLSGRHEHLQEYESEIKARLAGDDTKEFTLDVKYCRLREDLDVASQLFTDLIVQRTKHVINLVDTQPDDTRKSRRRHVDRNNVIEQNESSSRQAVAKLWQRAQEHVALTSDQEYLSPSQWNTQLSLVSEDDNAILLDCRNFYESNIGHFVCPNISTILTNTRKYSELPYTLLEERERLASSKQIFMYCTGGVRCERASAYLRALLEEQGDERDTKIYQLHGGIQRYLEQTNFNDPHYYRGKNFVFDPRRTDPVHNHEVIGICLRCGKKHDDYDNGHAPCEAKEARCCSCRILILVCDSCRPKVACWGEDSTDREQMFCGGVLCIHKPAPREIRCEILRGA